MLISPPLGRMAWVVIALLVTSIGTARGERHVSSQLIGGYAVALSTIGDPASPGDNQITVTIRDASGRAVEDAEVSVALIAYMRVISPNRNTTSNQHVHTPGASAAEGQGLIPAPVRLEAGSEIGTYRGALSFATEGTWTVVVAFTIQQQARAALFTIGVVDQRPRLALLGGFAAVNVGIIVAAAVRRRTRLFQPNRRTRAPIEGIDGPRSASPHPYGSAAMDCSEQTNQMKQEQNHESQSSS